MADGSQSSTLTLRLLRGTTLHTGYQSMRY